MVHAMTNAAKHDTFDKFFCNRDGASEPCYVLLFVHLSKVMKIKQRYSFFAAYDTSGSLYLVHQIATSFLNPLIVLLVSLSCGLFVVGIPFPHVLGVILSAFVWISSKVRIIGFSGACLAVASFTIWANGKIVKLGLVFLNAAFRASFHSTSHFMLFHPYSDDRRRIPA
jgi:uncharacterized Tic20 family protein